MNGRRRHAADAGVVVAFALVAAAFWKWRLFDPATLLVGTPSASANSGNGDIFTQTYPMWWRAARMWAKGEIPLWNPYQYAGHPFLATALYGVLYPLNLLLWPLPTAIAIEVANAAHMFAAGVFADLFGRSLGLSRMSAAFLGLTFMLSGFVAAETAWFPPAMASAAWLPLGLFAIERIVAVRSFRRAALLAVAIAMSALGGWMQTWVYCLYAWGAYAAVRLAGALRPPPNGARRAGALLAAGFALGLALAAVQLLPTLELLRLGPRRPGALSLAYTLVAGTTSPSQMAREMTDGAPGYPRFAYVGMLALVLAPLSVGSSRRRGRALFFAATAIASLAVALTIHTPALTLYRWLPGAAWFRKPQRILLLYAFAAAVLAGIGLEFLDRDSRENRGGRLAAALAASAALAAALLVVAGAGMRSWIDLVVALALLTAFAAIRSPRARAPLALALFALLLFELGAAARNPYRHPVHGTESLDAAGEIFDYVRAHQGHQRTYLYAGPFDHALAAKQGTLRGLYSITDYEPLSLSRYERFFTAISGPGESPPGPVTFTGRLVVEPDDPGFAALDLFGLRYLVAHRLAIPLRQALASDPQRWRQVLTSSDGEFLLFERTQPLPRAYVAHQRRHAGDEVDALRQVTAADFDARTTVVLEGEGAAAGSSPLSGSPIRPAEIEEYESDRVVIASDDDEPGWLVLTDTFYPGWQAEVNGRRVEIEPANDLFRAVPIAAGHQRIVFTYRPASFIVGAWISAAALLLIGLGLGRDFASRRRVGASETG